MFLLPPLFIDSLISSETGAGSHQHANPTPCGLFLRIRDEIETGYR